MLAVVLSPEARALIQADRDAHRPTAADRQRVDAALRARLGPSVLPAETPLRDLLLSIGWRVPSGAALGLCLIGGVLLLALHPAAVAGTASPALAASTTSPASSAADGIALGVVPAPTALVPAASTVPSPNPTIPAEARAPDPLAQEVALLSRAMTQLRSGNAAAALRTLDQHQARFPSGALSQERFAMKAQALCKLRRFREGHEELAGLARGSIAFERVKSACDAPVNGNAR